MNLVMTLYPMLHKEISLNLSKEVAPFSLGIRARKDELVLPPSLKQDWDLEIILQSLCFIFFQHALRNMAENPVRKQDRGAITIIQLNQ